jgi:hypothetical protein
MVISQNLLTSGACPRKTVLKSGFEQVLFVILS